MKLKLLVLLMVIIVSLSAQFSDPIHINDDLGEVFFRGSDACKIVGEQVYLTFVEAETGNVHCVYFNNGVDFTTTIVESQTLDDFTKLRRMLQPTIEVTQSGRIVIFYIIENDGSTILYKAISDDIGQTFTSNQIAETVSSFSSKSENSEILLSFQKGTSIPFTEFQYFTNSEKSENDDGTGNSILKFWGADELFGPVHSNDNIWVTTNTGYPNFEDIVTTSKQIRYDMGPAAPPTPDLIAMFPNGYLENIQRINYEPSLDAISTNGIDIGTNAEIVYLKMDGTSIQSMYGNIQEIGTQEFEVYSWFPHNAVIADSMALAGHNWFEEGDVVWTNAITMYDTIWTVGPTLPVDNQTYWIGDNSELWIEGEVNGMLTIGCAENISIVGDITYTNTVPGQSPDDPSNLNTTDYLGLASENKIILKYKHKDPFNNMELRDDNCNDIMLYGAFAALGITDTITYGNMACHYDGNISFEYQHPHGSTPDFTALSPYTLQETLYTFVDLHKYVFPPNPMLPPGYEGFNLHGGNPVENSTCGFPYESSDYLDSYPNNNSSNYVYPYGTDYPWYNPVWPESSDDIVFERGVLTIFGSMAQTRRGFMHRSGGDPYNHPDPSEWNIEEFHFDGSHSSAGYDKDYHYDLRLQDVMLLNFPLTNTNDEIPHIFIERSYNEGISFDTILNYTINDHIVQFMDIDFEDNEIMLVTQDDNGFDIHYSLDDGENFDVHEVNDIPTQEQFVESIDIYSGTGYINTKLYNEEIVFKFDPSSQELSLFIEENESGYLSTFAVGNSGCKIFVTFNGSLDFSYTGVDINSLTENISWYPPVTILSPYLSNISVSFNEQDSVYVNILNTDYNEPYNTEGELYFFSGTLENLVEIDDEEIIPPKTSLQIYPNPFNPETTISFSLSSENSENTNINIYNIKGQKVKAFSAVDYPELVEGSVTWNGKDKNGKSVSTGIYLFELRSDGKVQKLKKGLLLK